MCVNFSVILMVLLIAKAANGDITVETTNGPIRGTTVASGKVEAYLGVPYAEPPVGSLRFKKPVPKSSRKDVYDANQLPPACIQTKIIEAFVAGITKQSEDCLYLNIWVPKSRDKSGKKAIILFIHGGGFMAGAGSQKLYDGATLAEHGDVIVVTINYRLGGLGFFTAFTDDAPGNLGMYDQVAAIRWMKENAEKFQGDPNNIAIMGESAGAFGVSSHVISPLSKNLFRRAIILSGSILHPKVSDDNDNLFKNNQKYANIIGCTPNGETIENNPKAIFECIKNLPIEKFVEADTEMLTHLKNTPRDPFSAMLFPRVGDSFLPKNSIDSFSKGNFKDTELFIGITRDEGSVLVAIHTPVLFGKYMEKIPVLNETSTRQHIRNCFRTSDDSGDDKITQTYMDRVNEEEEYAYLKALNDAYGDYLVSCGTVFQADIQSLRNNPVYFYMFDYISPSSVLPKWMGVTHASELEYAFGNIIHREHTEMEKEFSQDLMDRLAAFAKTGNPNVPKGVTWPKYTFEDPKYLVLGQKDVVKTRPDHNRCEAWRKRFRTIIDDDFIRGLRKTPT